MWNMVMKDATIKINCTGFGKVTLLKSVVCSDVKLSFVM